MNASRGSTQIALGVLILLVGVALLLTTTGVVDIGDLARWIPSLFILLGLWQIVSSGFRDLSGPLTLIAIATFVQLIVLGVLSGDVLARWWPLIIILAGLFLILGRVGIRGLGGRDGRVEDEVNISAFMGGVDRRVISQAFRGGQVTSLMGGVNLDLRGTAVQQRPARLDVTVVMGGVDLRVPPDWIVVNDALTLLGGNSDERKETRPGDKGSPHLIVSGLVIFGGVTIKD